MFLYWTHTRRGFIYWKRKNNILLHAIGNSLSAIVVGLFLLYCRVYYDWLRRAWRLWLNALIVSRSFHREIQRIKQPLVCYCMLTWSLVTCGGLKVRQGLRMSRMNLLLTFRVNDQLCPIWEKREWNGGWDEWPVRRGDWINNKMHVSCCTCNSVHLEWI